ncbi:MAG: beta-lactamase family protein [Verrucomicrobiales bacterium]|nr:beta-lactamase family protein [Verrucomicrobiales bacterium]
MKSLPVRFLLLPLLLVSAVRAAPDDLTAGLESIRKQHQLPALGAIAFRGGKILAQGVVGVRKRGETTPATLADKWHLGSLTKSMTASLAAMLVADGCISWETTVAQALGEKFSGIHPALQGVTLQQLLEHRGGLAHDGPPAIWRDLWKQTGDTAENRHWWMQGLVREKPPHSAGDFDYSNAGYVLAATLLENAAGAPWENLVQTRLFAPLGLRSAGCGPPATPGQIDQPWGHRANGTPVPPGPGADNPPALGPAGTVHLTLQDLATYARWHLREGTGRPALLDAAGFHHLHTTRFPDKQKEGYACGWFVAQRPWASGPAINHSGSNNMNFAIVWLAPRRDFGFAVVTNIGGDPARKGCDHAASWLVGQYAEK